MEKYLDALPMFVDQIRKIREIIISNIVLIGQISAPTFYERRRAACLTERLADFQVDECSIDDFGNPIGVIRGTSTEKRSIFVVAHLDTFSEVKAEQHYEVTDKIISGVGVSDNSAAVGVLASLPEVFRRLRLTFESDIVLVAPNQSLARGNLRGIRRLLQTWPTPIRGAICLESVNLGRLNYYSDGMIRGEISCSIASEKQWDHHHAPNAILVINEVINAILGLRLPQKPRTQIVIGKIAGGFNHGNVAYDAKIGFEIRSDADEMVKSLYGDIRDIVDDINKAFAVELKLNRISNLNATRLPYNHSLVKCAARILNRLGVEAVSEPSETALSIFLQHKIPAVTLGLTHGDNYHQDGAMIEIEPMFKGISQIPALIMAMDDGVCDE
ncbi:MAG: peptidase dimerization domain-containing protein [Desulfosarcina sp.]|nr:peptidase dimerization domain-containing protein [Desulfosarcina sp.]